MSKDLFSAQASGYAKYRPGYPEDLIGYILTYVKEKKRAWDCATGNGQAALLLAAHFSRVEATDISEKQLDQAALHPAIHYARGAEDHTPFPDNSFDLITVAQAYHWFAFEAFHREAIRVSKPGGIVAVWGYGLVNTEDEKLGQLIQYFYTGIVGKYWDPERRYVDDGYRTIPFLFPELPSREFSITVRWTKTDFLGYLNTWSGVQHYIKANGTNPVDEFGGQLTAIWDDREEKVFTFPLFLRIGQVEK